MLLLHLWFIPLVLLTLLRLLGNQQYRDAVLFLFPTLIGYGLWIGIANHRPFIITVFIARIIETVKNLTGLS